MAGSLLSTASPASIYGYGATPNTRPQPALLTLVVVVVVSYYLPTSGTTARNPYRSVSTCSYRLSPSPSHPRE